MTLFSSLSYKLNIGIPFAFFLNHFITILVVTASYLISNSYTNSRLLFSECRLCFVSILILLYISLSDHHNNDSCIGNTLTIEYILSVEPTYLIYLPFF